MLPNSESLQRKGSLCPFGIQTRISLQTCYPSLADSSIPCVVHITEPIVLIFNLEIHVNFLNPLTSSREAEPGTFLESINIPAVSALGVQLVCSQPATGLRSCQSNQNSVYAAEF